MKKLLFVALAAILTTLGSFTHRPTESELLYLTGFTASATFAPAFAPIVYTDSETIAISQNEFIPCANGGTGEVVELSGNLHTLFHVTINGNHATFKGLSNPQGVSGTGTLSGETYQATGGEQFTGTTNYLNDGQWEGNYIVNYRIIGQRSSNNLLVRQVFHTTFNAQGVLTTQVENTSFECR